MFITKIKLIHFYRTYELKVFQLWIEDDISIPINAHMMFDTGTPLTFMEAGLFETLIHYVSLIWCNNAKYVSWQIYIIYLGIILKIIFINFFINFNIKNIVVEILDW
jgi:hypothetical protein